MTAPFSPIVNGVEADSATIQDRSRHDVTRWQRYWLTGARVGWLVISLLATGLFIASLPVHFRQLASLSDPATSDAAAVRVGLHRLGLPPAIFAAIISTLDLLFAAVYVGVAAVLYRRKSANGFVLLVSLTLVTFGTTFPLSLDALAAGHPAVHAATTFLETFGWITFFLLFYLFPDGRFVPRWTWIPAALWVGFGTLDNVLPRSPLSPSTMPAPLNQGGLYVLWLSMAGAQIYRYVRVSSPVARQQTKWAAFGFAFAMVTLIAGNIVDATIPSLHEPGIPAVFDQFLIAAVSVIAFAVLPIAMAIAILRYHLWEIDLLINRTLVYGGLTAGVIGLYALVVGGLGALFAARGSVALSLVATGLVAILVQPARERLQLGVNRLLYGDRHDPYAALARLGQLLEKAVAPGDVLPVVAATVRDALKLPYAAIALRHGDTSAIAAAAGEPVANPLRLPLIYQQEPIGELLVGPRAPGEAFDIADRRLLEDLARQVGGAVHAVRLTTDLQRSRERLVSAREEERRRLRRDLHDGLGPMLGSLTLKLDAARRLMRQDQDAADAVLNSLKAQTQTAIADIRRLVYALRPPALDELGLVGALRETAVDYGRPATNDARLDVVVEASEPLGPLPAAVEVAAYHIAQEALTNVARHARAQQCTIRLWCGAAGFLCLDITDDGHGLPPAYRPGVGLGSMRERAAELGGHCTIESRSQGGTVVRARLPLGGFHGTDPRPDR